VTDPAPGGAETHVAGSHSDGERLQKVLAQRGWGSRRQCEELISDGRVRVNGEIAILGRRVLVNHDIIEIDGAPVGVLPELVYYLLNKPVGVITTAKDTHNRETVLDLIPKLPQVHPVGRLDAETEGLLLITNDGELTHRITHPKFGLDKEYLVHVRCDEHGVSESALHNLRIGVDLDDGMTSPADVGQLQPGVLRVIIHEGRNRQIRRMCQQVGYPVLRLARVRIGPITDRHLRPGEYRLLTVAEVRSLIEAVTEESHGYA
jgi:23S rRNA pseudouridine2605 synthase